MAKKDVQLGIEDILWEAANTLRGSLDSSDYKHVVLGLLFLKYMFDEDRQPRSGYSLPTPGDLSWAHVVQAVESANPAQQLDNLVEVVESRNSSLASCFPRFSSFEGLAPSALIGLARALSETDLAASSNDGRDVLSRTYEYFLGKFAAAEGRLGGEFYTPQSIVRLMVGLLEPFSGTIYDPACGTGGLFVQAKAHAEASGRSMVGIRVVGQESNPMTWRLAKLNLALHGLSADLGETWGDTFTQDQHPSVKADFILTNPPFGKGTRWSRELLMNDARWRFGVPPAHPANFAWLQHYVARLSNNGVAVTVMPNGTLTSRGMEGDIRAAMIKKDLVECVISLPTQLFYSTPIPVSLWILNMNKSQTADRRRRMGEVLFIDARNLGHLTSRIHRDLHEDELENIITEYHAWQGRGGAVFEPSDGFSATRTIAELAGECFSLNPSQYVDNIVTIDPFEVISSLGNQAEELSSWLNKLEPTSKAAIKVLAVDALGLRTVPVDRPNWQSVRLGDVARVVGGGTPDTKNRDYFGGDVAWVTPRDMAGYHGRSIACGDRSLSHEGLQSCGAKLVPANSILVSTRAPIGLVALAETDLATNQGIRSIVLHDETKQDPRFWYYLLKASTAKLDSAGNGTTFRELRGSALADMSFFVPDIAQQRLLADFLSVMEDASETARQSERQLRHLIGAVGPAMVHGLLAPIQV